MQTSLSGPRRLANRGRVRHPQELLDPGDHHVQGDPVLAPLGHDDVGPTFGGFDELQMHGAHRTLVLVEDADQRAAPLFDVPADAAQQAHVGVGVDVDLEVQEISQAGFGQ